MHNVYLTRIPAYRGRCRSMRPFVRTCTCGRSDLPDVGVLLQGDYVPSGEFMHFQRLNLLCHMRASGTSVCFCSALAAAATLILLGIGRRGTTLEDHRLQPVALSPVLAAVRGAENGAPTQCAPASTVPAGAGDAR